jgi:hypothetical protein
LPFDRHQAAKTKLDEDPRVAAFRDDVRSRSMDLVHGRIPAKIIELHTLYKVRVQGEPIAAAVRTPPLWDLTIVRALSHWPYRSLFPR